MKESVSRRSLQQDRQLVFDLLDNLPHGVIALNQNWEPIFVNETLASLLGISVKIILKSQPATLAKWYLGSPDDSHLFIGCMQGDSFVKRGTLCTSVGGIVPVRINGFPLQTKKGDIDGVILLFHDLRQQLVWERSFDEYKHTLDSINANVMAIDIDAVITTCNKSAAKFWNRKQEDLVGQYLPEVQAAIGYNHSYLMQVLGSGKPCSFPELWLEFDGKDYLLTLECNPVVDSEGKTIGAVVIWRDISMQRVMELEADRAEKLSVVGELAASTAHEIRNPLTSIRGFIQLLENRFSSDAVEQEYLKIMLGELDRANEIIKNFLLLAKPQNPKLQLQDLNFVLEDLLKLIEAQATLTEVNLIRNFCSEMPFMVMETESIKQVFLNLLQNAIQAMPKGGTLSVTSEFWPEENLSVVKVRDTGVGMPREIVNKIGHPFFTTKKNGTGLGLAVSYRIIENHKGAIEVISKENIGTTFIVKLPIV